MRFTEHEWTFDGQPATHLAAEHFDLYTTVQDASWRAMLPEFLEDCHRKYASLVPDNKAGADDRLETYLFETRQQREAFTRLRFPGRLEVYRLIRSGGYTEGTISVCYSLGDRGQTLAVLAHEGLHQYLARYSTEAIPAWLNEGLATYCEALERDGRSEGSPPKNPGWRSRAPVPPRWAIHAE